MVKPCKCRLLMSVAGLLLSINQLIIFMIHWLIVLSILCQKSVTKVKTQFPGAQSVQFVILAQSTIQNEEKAANIGYFSENRKQILNYQKEIIFFSWLINEMTNHSRSCMFVFMKSCTGISAVFHSNTVCPVTFAAITGCKACSYKCQCIVNSLDYQYTYIWLWSINIYIYIEREIIMINQPPRYNSTVVVVLWVRPRWSLT